MNTILLVCFMKLDEILMTSIAFLSDLNQIQINPEKIKASIANIIPHPKLNLTLIFISYSCPKSLLASYHLEKLNTDPITSPTCTNKIPTQAMHSEKWLIRTIYKRL